MLKYIFIISALFLELIFAMGNKDLAIAINLAGKQRMLTQKMSKEALLISLKIDTKNNKKMLIQSAKLFDKTLKGLLYGDKELKLVPSNNKEIELKLNEVQTLWEPFFKHITKIANSQASKRDFLYIDKHNLKLLKTMNEAVVLYTKLGSSSSNSLKMANDINLAGKQRMLTQKMAKDLLLYSANIRPKKALKSLLASKELFSKTLDGLYNGSKELNLVGTKLPKIRDQLDKVNALWSETKPLITKAIKSKKNRKLLKSVILKLDQTKKEMNTVVELYAKSINRQKQYIALNSIINTFMHKKSSNKHLINLAGKQRMLTQRISKLSIECAYNLRENSCQKLDKFATLYEKTLIGFLNGDSDLNLKPTPWSDAKAKITELKKLWKPFKESVKRVENSNGKDKEALKYILEHNQKLLKESNNIVTIFVKNGSKKNVSYIEKALLKIVNIAGRERMLTQKMTKEYLQYKLFKDNKANSKKIATMKLFEDSLNNLINGNKELGIPKVTNYNIKKQLQKVKKIWRGLKTLYSKNMLTNKEFKLLLVANPILLKEMNKAVYMIDESVDY